MRSKRKNIFRRQFHRLPAWIRNKYTVTIAAILVWMVFFDRNNLISQIRLQMKLADYQQKKEYYEGEIASVKKEKEELLTNHASLEKFAREQYMMKKTDEDLYVIVPEQK